MEFTLLMCRLMLGRGNRAGAMIFSGKVDRTIPACGGRRQLLRILNEVGGHRPGRERHRPESRAGSRRPASSAAAR